MGGAKISRNNFEAHNQWQSEPVGENVVTASGLVEPSSEAGRHQSLIATRRSNSPKVCPTLRREHDHHLVDVLRLGIEVDSNEGRTWTAQQVILKDGTYDVASLGSFGFGGVAPRMTISVVNVDEPCCLTLAEAYKLGSSQAVGDSQAVASGIYVEHCVG